VAESLVAEKPCVTLGFNLVESQGKPGIQMSKDSKTGSKENTVSCARILSPLKPRVLADTLGLSSTILKPRVTLRFRH
jgi:hypothetical protein